LVVGGTRLVGNARGSWGEVRSWGTRVRGGGKYTYLLPTAPECDLEPSIAVQQAMHEPRVENLRCLPCPMPCHDYKFCACTALAVRLYWPYRCLYSSRPASACSDR
jgi:hypothetical protein